MGLESLARTREELVTATPTATAVELAGLMDRHNVGSVIIEEDGRVKFPLGIVTDRDIATTVVGGERPPAETLARDIMTTDLVTVDVDDGVADVCRKMGDHGVRRMPILDGDEVVGILTLDDLVVLLHDEMEDISSVILAESPPYSD